MSPTQLSLSRRFIMYKFFANLWFVGAIWLYFYRLFITDADVGVLEGLAFAIGLAAEVPSGALADRIGRDKLTKLGLILTGIGFLIQAAGSSLLTFTFGQAVLMIGVSFVSGADEALFFSKLQLSDESVGWRKLMAKVTQVTLVATFFATIIGGLLYHVHPRIPWVLTGVAFMMAATIIWTISDPREKQDTVSYTTELHNYVQSIRTGFLAFGNRTLRVYVPLIVTLQGLLYVIDFGLLKLILLDRFAFSTSAGAVLVALCQLGTVGVLGVVNRFAERLSEKLILGGVSSLAILSLIASVFRLEILGAIVLFILIAGNSIVLTFMSEVLNYKTNESQRATVLSVASFLRSVPYVVLAPIIGYLNTKDKLEYFLVGWAVLISIALAIYLRYKQPKTIIPIQFDASVTPSKIPELSVSS